MTIEGVSSSLVQTTGDPAVLTATQCVQAPGTRGSVTACKSATSPVEGPDTSVVSQQNATQPVEAPNVGTASQPVEAPGASPETLEEGCQRTVGYVQSGCRIVKVLAVNNVASLPLFHRKVSNSTWRGLHPPVPVQTQPNQITNCRKQLYEPSQKPFGGPVSAGEQNYSRTGSKPRTHSGFTTGYFLVPKHNNWWRPILDLSTLNTFLNIELFKMETPETIRTSLETGEWVTSIDFKDTYFHIPIHIHSRKYMRFHVQGRPCPIT